MSGINTKGGQVVRSIAAVFGAAIFVSSAFAGEGYGNEKFELSDPLFSDSAFIKIGHEFSTKYVLRRTAEYDFLLAVRPITSTRTQEIYS